MFNFFERIHDSIVDLWNKRKYGLAIFTSLFILIIFLTVAFFVWRILRFLFFNLDAIVMIVIGITMFSLYIIEYRKDKLRKIQEEQERLLAEEQALREQANIQAIEENYMMLSRILLMVLQNVSDVLGLKAVSSECDIESPVHHISMGDFYLYQFVVYRKNITMDVDMIREVLQEEIKRVIATGQVYGLQKMTHYLYEGQFYPFVMVHHVEECTAFLEITLAIASEQYLKFRQLQQTQLLTTLRNSSSSQPYDKDF